MFEKNCKNEIKPLGPAPELTKEALDQTNNIVGQMGHEPIVMALENGAQLILQVEPMILQYLQLTLFIKALIQDWPTILARY